MRMLESKGPLEDINSSGAFDLTFASRTRGPVGSERQIRSTSAPIPKFVTIGGALVRTSESIRALATLCCRAALETEVRIGGFRKLVRTSGSRRHRFVGAFLVDVKQLAEARPLSEIHGRLPALVRKLELFLHGRWRLRLPKDR